MTKKQTHHGGKKPYIPDPGEPVEMPLGYRQPKSLQQIISESIAAALSRETDEEYGSLEEENDFEEEDPNTLDLTAYELEALESEAIDNFELTESEPDPEPEPAPDPQPDPPPEAPPPKPPGTPQAE